MLFCLVHCLQASMWVLIWCEMFVVVKDSEHTMLHSSSLFNIIQRLESIITMEDYIENFRFNRHCVLAICTSFWKGVDKSLSLKRRRAWVDIYSISIQKIGYSVEVSIDCVLLKIFSLENSEVYLKFWKRCIASDTNHVFKFFQIIIQRPCFNLHFWKGMEPIVDSSPSNTWKSFATLRHRQACCQCIAWHALDFKTVIFNFPIRKCTFQPADTFQSIGSGHFSSHFVYFFGDCIWYLFQQGPYFLLKGFGSLSNAR